MNLNISQLKRKSLSLYWEFMYTRSLHQTPDLIEQHRLLNRVAELIDSCVLKTTLGEHYGTINAREPAPCARLHRKRQGERQGRTRRFLIPA